MSRALLLVVLSLVPACTKSSHDASEPRKIQGGNDLLPVNASASNVPSAYKSLVDAIGRLSTGCTVTHVGGGLAVTAGHCFGGEAALLKDLPCDGYSVYWGDRKGKAPYLKSTCERIVAKQTNPATGVDFALIRVEPAPTAAIKLELQAKPALGTAVTLFSHPDQRPLEWSGECKVEQGNAAARFWHMCDTEGGSSGAAVLSVATRRIVGIHDGGFEQSHNFATYVTDTPLKALIAAAASPGGS